MNLLSALKAHFMVAAAQAVMVTLEAGRELGVELVADAKELGGEILTAASAELTKAEHQVEDTFLDLVKKYSGVAGQFVTDLMPTTVLDGVTLDGAAKANLATVQLVDHAAQDGITLAATHASTMIQSAFLGVKDILSQLTVKAEAAIS